MPGTLLVTLGRMWHQWKCPMPSAAPLTYSWNKKTSGLPPRGWPSPLRSVTSSMPLVSPAAVHPLHGPTQLIFWNSNLTVLLPWTQMPLAPHCPQEKVQLLSQRFGAPTETSMAPPIPLSWDLVSPSVLISVVKTSASFTPKISAFSPLYLHLWSFSFLFFKNSQCGPFLKSYECVTILLLLSMFCVFGNEACGISAPWPGIKPSPSALEGEVLTSRPPGKSHTSGFVIPSMW